LEACVGDQAIYTSPPLSSNVLLAGNFTVDLTVTSSLPDGNLAAYLWHTSGQGTCPDPEVKEVRRAVASLRHWQDERGRDFPLDVPTAVTLKSLPFASVIPAGDRLVLAIGGDSWGLFPKVKPRLAITTGPQVIGSVTLPVVDGSLELSSQ
jgi:predicted acyl esterase